MTLQSKLKENIFPIVLGLTIGLLAITTMIWATRQMEAKTADQVIGGIWTFFALIQLVVWLRTKNQGYLIWMFACAVIAGSYFTGYTGVYFLIPAIILVTAYVYLLASRKMRWRYRDILELAAKPVEETQDGFTTRPFPAGVAEYTREELIRFGNYLSKNLIAFPFIEKERILFLINGTTRFLFRRPNAQQDTFVTFDFKGNIAVNIAKNDYKKYKAELTFDQLCASLGSLFKTFLQFYQEGKKDRIIPMIEEYVSRIHNARPEPDPSTQIKTESKSGNHAGH